MSDKLTEEDKKILFTLKLAFTNRNIPIEEFINDWKFLKDTSDVSEFFNSYLESKGLLRILDNQSKWWKKRHPYRKLFSNPDKGTKKWMQVAKDVKPHVYTADMYNDMSAVYRAPNVDNRIIIIGRNNFELDTSVASHDFILGHEFAHGKAPFSIFGGASFNNESALAEALAQNLNTEKNKHDEYTKEKHADIWGLKYLLYKEGIYDSRSNRDITIDKIKKLREKYPDLRPLQQMSDEQLMFMLNNVAMNENKLNMINNPYT